jgi:DNA uptake protein ComE-like DNA-binding protein
MRLYFLILIACSIMLTISIRANGKTSAWEVLEGCRLVSTPINDGDSFKVQHKDQTFIVRLYFVDCPEPYDNYMARVRDQARYFSIAEADVIAAGKLATAFTEKFLRGEFTVVTRWTDARGGKEPRFFALVRKNDQILSSELIRNGFARIYGMPTKGNRPDGVSPRAYLRELKQYERAAQASMIGIWGDATRSLQLAGLNQLDANVEATSFSKKLKVNTTAAATIGRRTSKLILNTAGAAELETLPGIGPALASDIIAARPIAAIDDLLEIPGITLSKIDVFRTHVLTDEPPPPLKTAAYYLADAQTYLDTNVTVIVSAVIQSDLAVPASFRAVILQTANQGVPGSSIPAFIPDEFYEAFVQYYQEPGRSFTGLLFQHDSNIVLVYSRK